jgi:hypothetical protein
MGFDLWKTLGVSAVTGLIAVVVAFGLAGATAFALRVRRSRPRMTGLGLGGRP